MDNNRSDVLQQLRALVKEKVESCNDITLLDLILKLLSLR